MKKTLLMILGLLVVMSVSSFATETRVLVMGDNYMTLVDDYNMFMFPGRVNNYPNLALGDFADEEMYQLGITWQFNDDNPWVLGTFVSTEPQFGPSSYWSSNLAGFDYASTRDEPRFTILYGRQLGGNNFGFGIQAVRYSDEYEDVTEGDEYHIKESFSQYTFNVGLTEGTSGQWDVGLSFMTGTWTNEWNDTTFSEPDGYYDLALAGRYFMVRNPKITMVPHVAFTIGKRGVKFPGDPGDSDDDMGVKYSRTGFELGWGMNYTPAPNMLAVFDIGLQYEKIKTDGSLGSDEEELGTDTWFSFPYIKIGFEGEVFSWMDIRAGANGSLWTSKQKEEYTEYGDYPNETWTWDYAYNETYLGFGFHWNRLYLDTYTDPELLLKGFDFINGSDYYDSGNMNWMVSMTYELF